MSTFDQYAAAERSRKQIAALVEKWERICRYALGHQYPEALALTMDALPDAHALAEERKLTTTYWPVCVACIPQGSGETTHHTEAGKLIMCATPGAPCFGNQYGRMHPLQLRDYLERIVKERADRAESVRAGSATPPVPLSGPLPPMEPQPTRPVGGAEGPFPPPPPESEGPLPIHDSEDDGPAIIQCAVLDPETWVQCTLPQHDETVPHAFVTDEGGDANEPRPGI